ncbi:hypothetical protein SANTM175S_07053 [Streptomyces antimycoticus]
MEVTRFDAGTARLVLDDVDVADQVTAYIDARAWLDAVELDAARGIVARLDPRRLDVILANLIGNALKHGGSPVRVSVRTDGEELQITVRDHGLASAGCAAACLRPGLKALASRPRSEGCGFWAVDRDGERPYPRRRHQRRELPGMGGAVFTLRLPMDASRIASDEAEDDLGDLDREGAAEGERDDGGRTRGWARACVQRSAREGAKDGSRRQTLTGCGARGRQADWSARWSDARRPPARRLARCPHPSAARAADADKPVPRATHVRATRGQLTAVPAAARAARSG